MITEAQILTWLEEVKDPEIPVLSLVDLGVVRKIQCDHDKTIVTITPTFVGCPALQVMKDEIVEVLMRHRVVQPVVEISYKEPWSSDFLSEKGRVALKSFGLATPGKAQIFDDIELLERATCPNCGSDNTELTTPFGPTLCRSIHYCHHCKEAFEQFKPL